MKTIHSSLQVKIPEGIQASVNNRVVTIKGKRYEARVEVGTVDAGTKVKVTEVSGFGLIVEPEQEDKRS